MYLVGPYLFSGDELDAYLQARKAEAISAARAAQESGDSKTGGAELVKEIFERFRIPETGMLPDKAFFSGERPLDDEECESIGVRVEDRESYKSIGIVVPYSGDEHLFVCRPTIYSAHQPQAEVKDGCLHMQWFLNEVEESQLENNFKRQIALIDRTLEVSQWQAMGCNQEMMEALKQEILGAPRAAAGEARPAGTS